MGTNLKTFDQIMEEHEVLKGMLHDLRDYLENPRPDPQDKKAHAWASDLANKLVHLHDLVFRHFHEEEDSGLFDELIVQHPRAAKHIESLLGEHGSILGELRGIVSAAMVYSESTPPEQLHLRIWTSKTLDELQRHEKEESALILDLHYEDLGSASSGA